MTGPSLEKLNLNRAWLRRPKLFLLPVILDLVILRVTPFWLCFTENSP